MLSVTILSNSESTIGPLQGSGHHPMVHLTSPISVCVLK